MSREAAVRSARPLNRSVVMAGFRKRRKGGENAERLVVGLVIVDLGLDAGDVAGRKLGLALGHLVEAWAVMDTAQDETDRLPLDAYVVVAAPSSVWYVMAP